MIRIRRLPVSAALTAAVACFALTASLAAPSEDGSWFGRAAKQAREAEYAFSPAGDETWSAPNRSHDLRSFVSADGLRLVPRRPAEPPWEMGLRLTSVGRGDLLEGAGSPTGAVSVSGNRLEIPRVGLVEWYVNMPEGIEQGFTLTTPPPGASDEPVVLEMEIAGSVVARLTDGDRRVHFRTASGSDVLRYGTLVVLDAGGHEFPATFELAGRSLRIVTSDAGAIYPLIVDPLIVAPDWSVEGNQADSSFGRAVAMGDLNCDGFHDVIVGADDFDNGEFDEGKVFVYFGSASGPSTTADWTLESNHTSALLGRTVASAGDVNNDGCDEIIVGAPEYDDDDGSLTEHDEGWAFLFYGSPSGPGGGPSATVLSADWVGQANQVEAAYGRRVRSAGDVNNDGYDDVIIGASEYTNDQSFEGVALLYLGSASGLGPNGTPQNADWSAEGNQVDALFGHALASAGDVNKDGRDDVIVGAENFENNFFHEGRVELFLGTPTGLAASPVWVLDGGQDDMRLGVAVDSAGDVNNDGYDDVVIGADIFSNGQVAEGTVFVYYGLGSGLLGTTPAWSGEVNQGEAYLGFSVARAGDANNDGYDDIIVGADGYDNGELDEGAAFLYYGSASGLPSGPSRTFEIEQAAARLGIAVAGGGDVNGDGFDDVLAAADNFTAGQTQEGGAFLYYGCLDPELDGVCQAVDNCPDLANPEQEDTDLDGVGDVCDPCEDVDVDGVCDAPRVLVEDSGPGEQVLVQEGALIRWLANSEFVDPGIDPPLAWTQLDYIDAQFAPWAIGIYGAGYEISATGGANDLISTVVPDGSVSIFTRAGFVLDDVNEVETLFIGAEWDDAYVAWINGVEVFRSPQMPAGVPLWNTKPLAGHECSNGADPSYGELHDISFSGIPALKTGQNVLAVGVWNTSLNSSDLLIIPRLSINLPIDSTMRYLANNSNPGLADTWTQTGFNEEFAGWTPGNYGVGFDTQGSADDLINTEIPTDTVSVFTRARFNVDRDTVDSVFLGVEHDDAFVAWINGTEVARSSNLPNPGVYPGWNADPSPPHESSNGAEPVYEPLIDITGPATAALFQGENVLAIGAWNSSTDTDDLVLVPRLSINEGNVDNCVGVYNPLQEDLDGDDIGDACDPDIDGDLVDNVVDNCPLVDNPPSDCDNDVGTPDEQCDFDADGVGDVCDSCPDDPANDADSDGVCEGDGYSSPKVGDNDNCPGTPNPPEDCDNDVGTPDEQCDLDTDGLGDACDPDIDGDTVENGLDNCPETDNLDQTDTDSDNYGDACDCVFDDDQAWAMPADADTVMMVKFDSCGNYACSESGGVCSADTECSYDYCENQSCSLSGGPCLNDTECEQDSCENFLCSAGANPCVSDTECVADFCANRTCTAGANGCTSDADCTADTCTGMQCLASGLPCASHFDCIDPPGDICVGTCSIGGNLCAPNNQACTADVCSDGTCSVGLNVCSDDSVCTADVCEGSCSVGANTCTSDTQCTAPQIDLCEGTCTLGLNVCGGDGDCTVPQTDLCQGACTIGTNACSSDAACVAPDVDTLFWLEPADFGGTSVVFDTLRSPASSDFNAPAVCVETDGLDRITSDPTVPAPGGAFYYLIRVENGCPTGNMGSGTAGLRTGKVCE